MCTAKVLKNALAGMTDSPQTQAGEAEGQGRVLGHQSRNSILMSNAEKLDAGKASAQSLMRAERIRGSNKPSITQMVRSIGDL